MVYLLLKLFKLFDFEGTWWRLFQKRVVRTKFDIYVLLSFLLLHWNSEFTCCCGEYLLPSEEMYLTKNIAMKVRIYLKYLVLYFFFWPLCCLFFFDIRILITPLVSSNSSFNWPWVAIHTKHKQSGEENSCCVDAWPSLNDTFGN